MGIWLDSGEGNVIVHCTVNASGDAAGIGFEIGIDGTLSHNFMLSNDIQKNGHGITLTAGNFTDYKSTYVNSNNAVCYNTVKNNLGPGIWDQHAKNNVYIGNIVSNNNDGNTGVVICDIMQNGKCVDEGNDKNFIFENESRGATDSRCDIPANLQSIPGDGIPKPGILGVSTNNSAPPVFQMLQEILQTVTRIF